MLYFTIDEETGERIPKQGVAPVTDKLLQVPASLYTAEDTDLSKELAELGEIADFLEENQDNCYPDNSYPTNDFNAYQSQEQNIQGERTNWCSCENYTWNSRAEVSFNNAQARCWLS